MSTIYTSPSAYAPSVAFNLSPGRAVIAETSSLLYKDAHISLRPFGVNEANAHGRGWLRAAASQSFSGSLVSVEYKNTARDRVGRLVLQPNGGGTVLRLSLDAFPGVIALQNSFMAATTPVRFETKWTVKNPIKMWLGEQESFMQQISLPENSTRGHSLFLEVPQGRVLEKKLRTGEAIDVHHAAFVGMTPSVTMDLEKVPSLRARWFSNETRYFTRVKGPGTVWLASKTVSYAGKPSEAEYAGLVYDM